MTGLPNRLAATERLRTEFVSMKRSQSVYAVHPRLTRLRDQLR